MTGKRVLKSIRRCCECGYKTHQSRWQNKQCPICGSTTGYSLSSHGGLTKNQMEEKKEGIEKIKRGKKGSKREALVSSQS